MARQITITDDLDGSPNAETVSYSVDGQDYEIDLSPENREKFRQALAPYLAKSRAVESPSPPPAPDPGAVGSSMLGRMRRSRAASPGASPDGPPSTGPRARGPRLSLPPHRKLWVPLLCLVLLGGLAAVVLPRLLGGPPTTGVRPVEPVHCTVKAAREAWGLRPTRLGIKLQHHRAL